MLLRRSSTTLMLCIFLLGALTACGSTGKKPGNFTAAPGQKSNSRRGSSEPNHIEASELNVSLGQAYLAKGQLELAMDKLKKAVALNPQSSDAHTLLGVLYEQINNDKLAEEHYRRALKLTPEAGASNNNLGRFLCARGKFADADKFFAQALADPFYKSPETALVNRAACAMSWGKRDIAEASLRAALQASPENSVALLQMARLAYEDQEYLRARAFLERHLSHSPSAPDTLLLGMNIEQKLGDRKTVDNYRRRLLTEFPDSEQATTAAKASHSP